MSAYSVVVISSAVDSKTVLNALAEFGWRTGVTRRSWLGGDHSSHTIEYCGSRYQSLIYGTMFSQQALEERQCASEKPYLVVFNPGQNTVIYNISCRSDMANASKESRFQREEMHQNSPDKELIRCRTRWGNHSTTKKYPSRRLTGSCTDTSKVVSVLVTI